MFISVKRHEREKLELLGAKNRLTEAILKTAAQGLFLLDGKDKILPPVSHSLAGLFRRQDFANLSFEKLLAPVVTAKTLTVVRTHIAALRGAGIPDAAALNPLRDVEVRLTNADGSFDAAHYSFEFDPVFVPNEGRAWLVRVTDITAQVQGHRDLDELREQHQTQGEILRAVLQMGRAHFDGFMEQTAATMKTLAAVLESPPPKEDEFRHRLDEILDEVDRFRRNAAAFKLTALEGAARNFAEALHELRNRSTLSGGELPPLQTQLDPLLRQFEALKSLTSEARPRRDSAAGVHSVAPGGGIPLAEAPSFSSRGPAPQGSAAAHQALAGSLENTLQALTEHVAQDQNKQVLLDCSGLESVPPHHRTAIKNVAIQLIRNAVIHGIEPPAVREASGKAARGTLRLDFRLHSKACEFLFDDDGCGLIPERVRETAVARGILTAEAAADLRDRDAIKLIFKSRYTTLPIAAGDLSHGSGMSLVRGYVHEAGGKIALASRPGYETRFKITLPVAAGDRLLDEPATAAVVATPAAAAAVSTAAPVALAQTAAPAADEPPAAAKVA
jgi:signal transduction histidine kinase